MDSCTVKRGFKSGLETRIRNDKASHLLGVSGDVCHHIHNSSKKISAQFDNFIETLFTNLANYFKWLTYLRPYLEEICQLLSMKFTMPERFLSHRWLSCYDVTVSTLRMMDAFIVFFYSNLSAKEKLGKCGCHIQCAECALRSKDDDSRDPATCVSEEDGR